jgi:radical SAM protein with 4Fe4S-binding SPASM domain
VHRVLARRRPAGGAARPARLAPDGIRRAGRAVTDGNGFVFVDHTGNICPSGFLPLTAGNVRRDDLVAVYRASALFTALRDPAQLGGRCGRCEYRDACGGSRARAFAAAGDPLAEDPGCAWQPAGRAVAAIAGGSDAAQAVSESAVRQALDTVLDPELGMSIVDLGLVYGMRIRNGAVEVTMTLTAPGCPIHDVMPEWVRTAVLRVPGVERVDVTLTFEPAWTPDRIRRSPASQR